VKNDHIEISISSLPTTLDPAALFFQSHFLITQSLFQSLVRIDESGQIVGDLVNKWTIKNQAKTYSFELKDAEFHDGRPVTAEDIAFSLSRHFWPGLKSPASGFLRHIVLGAEDAKSGEILSGIVVTGAKSVEINLNAPYPPFLFVLAMPSFSTLSKDAMRASGTYVGSGPMILKNLAKDRIEMSRFEKYSGSRARIKSIAAVLAPTTKDAIDLLQKGLLDVAILGLDGDDIELSEMREHFKLTKTNTIIFNHLFPNLDNKFLQNERFRADLAALICHIAFNSSGRGRFQQFEPFYFPRGVMPPSYYDKETRKLPPIDFKNRWSSEISDASPLIISLMKSFFTHKFCEDLKIGLSSAGLKIDLRLMDRDSYQRTIASQDYDLMSGGYVGNFPDPDGFLDPILGASGWTYGKFDRTDFVQKIASIRHTSDSNLRLKSYADAVAEIESKKLVFPLFREHFIVLHNNKVKIPEASFQYESELWNMMWDGK
jgi:peptide/nickel transport system substrate-binding protein